MGNHPAVPVDSRSLTAPGVFVSLFFVNRSKFTKGTDPANVREFETHVMTSLPHQIPPGWKPGDTAARDGRRHGAVPVAQPIRFFVTSCVFPVLMR